MGSCPCRVQEPTIYHSVRVCVSNFAESLNLQEMMHLGVNAWNINEVFIYDDDDDDDDDGQVMSALRNMNGQKSSKIHHNVPVGWDDFLLNTSSFMAGESRHPIFPYHNYNQPCQLPPLATIQ